MPQRKNGKDSERSVNLAHKAAGKSTGKSSNKKKSSSTSRKVIIAILLTVIVGILVFLIIGGIQVYKAIASPGKDVEEVEMTLHFTTPAKLKNKLSYYVLGLLGEETTAPTEMLSIISWDKEKNTLNIIQLPQDTYLGDSGRWAVKRVADVWGNPKPLDWCISCRRDVAADEISDGKHTVCQTILTKEVGSASEDLCGVFNGLLGLPVDGYFLFRQESLVKLVDLLGGLDVNLETAISVKDINYKKGVQTLDGNASLYYAINRKSGINGDIDRMINQRKVFLALFQRLALLSEERLNEDYIGPLMNGSTPLLTDFKRLEISKLIASMSKLEPSAMTAYILPGRTGSKGGKSYFAPLKSPLLSLLNESFNPFGQKLTDVDLGVTELGSGKSLDTRKQVLSSIAVPQSGAIVTKAETTTTKS